ncbi:MAG: hypothetical protein FWC73_00780 [Defluviitaleaceae bacterium]|nr:hypothetical protein [Defluviitaleaceae bacterium]
MAGYLFQIGNKDVDALERCVNSGVYSTIMGTPKGYWSTPYEATIGDYLSMKAGDNVYFFMGRKIYGIGRLMNIGDSCRYKNYPQASIPKALIYEEIRSDLLWDNGPGSENMRWLCIFEPYPVFFRDGVDMDDLLSSAPDKIRMIRAMQQVSFIKMDDEENKAVRDYLAFKNRAMLNTDGIPFDDSVHEEIRNKISPEYNLQASEIMNACSRDDGKLGHEMALECGIIELLATHAPEGIELGQWDYISQQVMASPFKPLMYADKMDIFGYRYIAGLPYGFDTVSDYLVIELKKDTATSCCIEQTLKYVEWIKNEYANGDYSRIKAFLIAFEFDQSAHDAYCQSAIRHYTEGGRLPRTAKWHDLKLLQYTYDSEHGQLNLHLIV